MQFLVVTRQSAAPPVGMMLPLMDAMDAWLAQHRASGKIEQVWSFAGTGGGGGVSGVTVTRSSTRSWVASRGDRGPS